MRILSAYFTLQSYDQPVTFFMCYEMQVKVMGLHTVLNAFS